MGEWRREPVADLIHDGRLTIGDGYRAKNDELGKTGLPFCRAGNVSAGFDFTSADRYPSAALDRVGQKVSRPGDVVFTSKGTVGRFAFVTDAVEPFVYSPQLCYWRSLDRSLIDPRYLYYWMSGPDFGRQFGAVASQTDMAEYVSLGDQRRMWLTLPPIDEQHRIAEHLGALDDKVQLNRAMQATLESLGRLDFRTWAAAQDPEAFRPLEELCTILSGGTPSKSTSELWVGDIPWISPKVMNEIHSDEPEHRVAPAAVGRGTRLAPRASTLVMVRGMGLHEKVRVSQAQQDVTFNQDVKALVPRAIEPALLLFALLDAQGSLLGRVESSGHGTGVLPTSALASHLVPAPRREARSRIASRLGFLNDRIGLARRESRTLAATRDRLLPRLLDGSLDVQALAQA